MFKDLVIKARSFRRFDNSEVIGTKVLYDIIDTAHWTPSAANRQPISFIISNKKESNDLIFPTIGWAGYLTDWQGPEPHEQPTAYIMLCTETQFLPHLSFDVGIIAQTIQLAVTDLGLGACMIASFDKNKLKKILNMPEEYELLLVIAIGKPVEKVVLEEVERDGDIKYYRDENGVHHVPKRIAKITIFDA